LRPAFVSEGWMCVTCPGRQWVFQPWKVDEDDDVSMGWIANNSRKGWAQMLFALGRYQSLPSSKERNACRIWTELSRARS
jgi:hypothetical protein